MTGPHTSDNVAFAIRTMLDATSVSIVTNRATLVAAFTFDPDGIVVIVDRHVNHGPTYTAVVYGVGPYAHDPHTWRTRDFAALSDALGWAMTRANLSHRTVA